MIQEKAAPMSTTNPSFPLPKKEAAAYETHAAGYSGWRPGKFGLPLPSTWK